MEDIRIAFTEDSLTRLGMMFNFTICGGRKHPSGAIEWELVFPNMIKAVSFAQVVQDNGTAIDIKFGDMVGSLFISVVLTLIVEP